MALALLLVLWLPVVSGAVDSPPQKVQQDDQMSMTNEEAHEINRRVAVALELKPGRGGICKRRLKSMPGYASCFPLPDFCRDPAAADLVREEIECRGWDWDAQSYIRDDGTRFYSVTIGRMGARKNMFQRGRSEDSHHHALCLAFLAADEATKAEEGGEG